MLKLRWALVVFISILSFSLVAQAANEKEQLRKYFPKENEVKSWKIYPGSFQYAKGDQLTQIYDGGYQLYTRHGVIDAATQIYTRGDDQVQVTVHTLNSAKSAKSFYLYWKKQLANTHPKDLKLGDGAVCGYRDGTLSSYLIKDRILVSVIGSFQQERQARRDCELFLKSIVKKR
jgi:hypothetical protein